MLFEEKYSRQNLSVTLQYQNMQSILHCQTSAEILLVSRGVVRAVCRDRSFLLHAGECIWVMPYEVHSYDTVEENEATVYIFSPDMMPDLFQMMDGKKLADPVVRFSADAPGILAEEKNDLFQKKSVLYALASKAVQAGIEKADRQYSDLDPMCRMMLFIQDHFRENITMHDLAQHMGYSYNYASHLFRRCFPMGFCETVNMHRLEEAARLLKENPKSMMDVADQAGFSTIRSFNSAFKKRFSMTPSEYAQRWPSSKPYPRHNKIMQDDIKRYIGLPNDCMDQKRYRDQ